MDINANDPLMGGIRPSYVEKFDDCGFAIFTPGREPENERCHNYSRNSEDEQLIAQYEQIMKEREWKCMRGSPSVKIQTMIRQGVPAKIRPILWTKLLDACALRDNSPFHYEKELSGLRNQLVDIGVSEYAGTEAVGYLYELELADSSLAVDTISNDCLRHIFLDLDRSYPTHRSFMQGTSEGIEGCAALFRVLALYARYNGEVGYCQGMSYLGGVMLMVMEDEQQAFWCLVSMLERFKYLRGYYDQKMERIQCHIMVFSKLLEQRRPAIFKHLSELGIAAAMFATPWFLSLYTSLGSWDSVLAIWDLFMLDGAVTIFRVGLGIIDTMEDCIMTTNDISHVLPLLLHPSHQHTAFLALMPAVYNIHLEDWEIAKLEAVVMEETGVAKESSTSKRHNKRDALDEPFPKRRRTDMDAPPPKPKTTSMSFFQRFVNIFTPREQRHQLTECPEDSASKLTRKPSNRRRNHPQARTKVIPKTSLPESARRVLTDEGENATKISTRTRRPSCSQQKVDLNAPTDRRLIGSPAGVQYSFRHFSASKPLRPSQLRAGSKESLSDQERYNPSLSLSPLEMKPVPPSKT